jgi:HrpA-like RNA helicase
MVQLKGIMDVEGVNVNPLTDQPYTDDYRKLAQIWSKYPAYKKADTILKSIDNNQLTFIVSGTGSGKTVLIPKFALHYTDYRGKVGITLPKKVVTASSAEYAAKTLDVKLGESIGYKHKNSPSKYYNMDTNKILYMTDGVLIMKFTQDPLLSEFNVIIIDEAHERKIQIDLLLLYLKNLLLSGKRPDLRVIIMSATIDYSKYQNYFHGVSSNVINISGQPNYSIEVHYHPVQDYLLGGIKLADDIIKENNKRDMLFFVTSGSEAKKMCKKITPKNPKLYCTEVYSDMDRELKAIAISADQYKKTGMYDQKLVIATNVAESSLTIDGLKYVIDSGYELASRFDPKTYGNILEKRLITQAQALQRRGRVGRTEPGICYHLMTKDEFDNLAKYPEPDILKEDLTSSLLQTIKISPKQTLHSGLEMFQALMDPPLTEFIQATRDLYQIYDIVDNNGRLTQVGEIAYSFPSVPINRVLFIIYSYNLHCAKEACDIIGLIDACGGHLENIFYKKEDICQSRIDNKSQKILDRAVDKTSDHISYLNIYNMYRFAKDRNKWAQDSNVRIATMRKASQNSMQYFRKLRTLLDPKVEERLERVVQPKIGKNNKYLKNNLKTALQKSHIHLTAKHNRPVMLPTKTADISRNSMVDPKKIGGKAFIYDQFVSLERKWEFVNITIIE